MQSDELFSNKILALLDVIHANGLGLWELSDGVASLDQKVSETIGMEGKNQLSLEELLELVHEEDRQEFQSALENVTNNPGKSGMAECRFFNKKEQSYSWIRLLGKGYLNKGKKVILGTSQIIEGRALDLFNSMLDNITLALNKKDELNRCVFEVTEILLNTNETIFEQTFQHCLEVVVHSLGLARIYIYKNHLIEGTTCCTQIIELTEKTGGTLGEEFTKDRPLRSWPGVEEMFSQGKHYKALIKDAPQEIQKITPNGIEAILLVPIFLRDLLWGFAGYEWTEKQFFSDDEEAALSSIGLLLANALINNDLSKNLTIAVDRINTTAIKAEVLEKFAYTDVLTGLYNRRHFLELAEKPLEKAKRFNCTCYAMILDFDFFKKINDTYGHLAGDEVLKNAAAVMKYTLRSYDILARYGGEEFVVFITDTAKDDVINLAERIRESIADTPCIYNCIKIPVTVSIGIAASFPDCTIESIIDKADKGLYKAKELGRNCVVFYEDTNEPAAKPG